MADNNPFGFSPEKMMDFFKTNDVTKMFGDVKMPDFDHEALFAAQKKNMDALVEANKAAAAGYQDLYKKQLAIFEATVSEAQAQIKDIDLKVDSASASARAELGRGAESHGGKAEGLSRLSLSSGDRAPPQARFFLACFPPACFSETRARQHSEWDHG